MSRSARPLTSYYYSQRPSSDSGLSSDDLSVVTSDDESLHCYENLEFPLRQDKSIRDNCEMFLEPPPPPPPLDFRDNNHLDGIDHKENSIELSDCISVVSRPSNDSHRSVLADGSNMTLPNPIKNNVEILYNNKTRRKPVWQRQDDDVILSKLGTVRGIRHRVTSVKQNLLESLKTECLLDKQAFLERERDKCIIYVTSLGVVRRTLQRCCNIRKILRNLCVRVLEKDLYLSREYRTEISARLQGGYSDLALPLVFISGELLGDADQVEKLNESGELRRLLASYQDKEAVENVCRKCGDASYIVCSACSGSKVGTNIWHGSVKLRCTQCEETGLVRCEEC